MSQISGVGADEKGHVLFGPGRTITTPPYRVLADLPDDGDFTTPDPWNVPLGVPAVSVLVPCQAGAGASSSKVLVRPAWVYEDGTEVPDGVLDTDFAVPAPFASRAIYPAEYTITPVGAELYKPPPIVLAVPPGAVGLKVALAEGGDTAHPCAAAVHIAAGS